MWTYMNRIFFFGCSYTHFAWPTWADILGVHASGYAIDCPELNNNSVATYNFGRSGDSNAGIMHRLLLANAQYNFKSDDIICVQWTSKFRHSIATSMVEHTRTDYASADYSISHCYWQEVVASRVLNSLKSECGANIYQFDFDAPETEKILGFTGSDGALLAAMEGHDSPHNNWNQLATQGGYDSVQDSWYTETKHIDAHPSPYHHCCVARAVAEHVGLGELSQTALDHATDSQAQLWYGWNRSEHHTIQSDEHRAWKTLTQVVRKSYVSEVHASNSMECEPSQAQHSHTIQRLLNNG